MERRLTTPSTIYVVRHAPALVSGICYGQSDVAVSPAAPQATERVLALLPRGVQRLFSSPSRRAVELATEVAARTKLPLYIDERLSELHFGTWEGREWDELYQTERAQLTHWAAEPMTRAPPGGETGRELVERVSEFVDEQPVANALLVCHAGPIRVLRALSLRREDPQKEAPGPVELDFRVEVTPLAIETIAWHGPAPAQRNGEDFD